MTARIAEYRQSIWAKGREFSVRLAWRRNLITLESTGNRLGLNAGACPAAEKLLRQQVHPVRGEPHEPLIMG